MPHRFFAAALLPDDAKDRLVAVQPPAFPAIRLIGRQELHLTLHFLGEFAPRCESVVRRALSTVTVHAFTITIRGIGRFPDEGQPQVLWAGVERSPALLMLHNSISSALSVAIGFRPEARPYSPHVTLARLSGPAPPGFVEHYLEENQGLQVPPSLINRFALFSSILEDDLPKYREEAVVDLL